MKKIKNLIVFTAVAAMLSASSQNLNAEACVSDVAGYGYEECCSAPSLTPAMALGAIALVAIIALAIQNSSHGHCHSHGSSD